MLRAAEPVAGAVGHRLPEPVGAVVACALNAERGCFCLCLHSNSSHSSPHFVHRHLVEFPSLVLTGVWFPQSGQALAGILESLFAHCSSTRPAISFSRFMVYPLRSGSRVCAVLLCRFGPPSAQNDTPPRTWTEWRQPFPEVPRRRHAAAYLDGMLCAAEPIAGAVGRRRPEFASAVVACALDAEIEAPGCPPVAVAR